MQSCTPYNAQASVLKFGTILISQKIIHQENLRSIIFSHYIDIRTLFQSGHFESTTLLIHNWQLTYWIIGFLLVSYNAYHDFVKYHFLVPEGFGCSDASIEQVFQIFKMVGCDGRYTRSSFRLACSSGWHVAFKRHSSYVSS